MCYKKLNNEIMAVVDQRIFYLCRRVSGGKSHVRLAAVLENLLFADRNRERVDRGTPEK